MKNLRSYLFVLLIVVILLVQACDENEELFENNYPVYDDDLLNFEGITETDETGRKTNNIDQGDWLELHYNLRDGSSDFFFEPWFWCLDTSWEYSSGKVFINWTTPSESDFLFWDILRSDNDNLSNAEIINEEHIPAKGTAFGSTDYFYLDENITANETYHYWLKLTKVDSILSYWGPMTLTTPSLSFGPAYSNPSEDQAIIPILLSEEKEIEMYVINETGDLLDVLVDDNLGSGLHNILWNASDKENGLYRVIFHCEDDTLHYYGDILIER